MTDIDTLVHARWVIPVVPRAAVLERHAIAVADGRIVDVLPSAEATQRYRAAAVHVLDNHAVTPGLVNCHTHAAMALMRVERYGMFILVALIVLDPQIHLIHAITSTLTHSLSNTILSTAVGLGTGNTP